MGKLSTEDGIQEFLAVNKRYGCWAWVAQARIYSQRGDCTGRDTRYYISDGKLCLTFKGKTPQIALNKWWKERRALGLRIDEGYAPQQLKARVRAEKTWHMN